VEHIESSLAELQSREVAGLFQSEQDFKRLDGLVDRASKCFSEIEAFIGEIQKRGKDGEKRVGKVKWLWKRKDIQKLRRYMMEVEGALHSTWNLVHSYVFCFNHQRPQFVTDALLRTISYATSRVTPCRGVKVGWREFNSGYELCCVVHSTCPHGVFVW